MKFFRAMLILMLPVIALVFGFWAGLLKSSSADSGTSQITLLKSQEVSAISNSVEKQQINLLLVSLGSRSAGNLQSAWLVSLHTSNPHRVNFVPLYPNETAGAEQLNELLASQFNLSAGGEISTPFLETLQAMYLVELDAYISLDRIEFAQAINYLGGIQLDEQLLSGDQVLALIDQSQENGNNQLARAADVITGMCLQMSRTTDNSRLSTLADFLAAHLSIFDAQSGMSTEVLRNIIYDPKLACSFPTIGKN
jgi:hypothetical protein